MPYVAEISRKNPTAFVFLLDQSGSMSDPMAGTSKTKADAVADAINKLLQTLILRCAKSEGIRDYFHVGVIGYGDQAAPALRETLTGPLIVPIRQLADHPLRIEQRTKQEDDGAGGIVSKTVKFPVWFDAKAEGLTLMCKAFELAWNCVNDFLVRTPGCFPPTIINITDGEATDGDPEPYAQMLRQLASEDGNALVFNVHLSSREGQPIVFADRPSDLPDDYARLLFRMSSSLPPQMLAAARREGYRVTESTRGFVFNANIVSLIKFLDIGTRRDPGNE